MADKIEIQIQATDKNVKRVTEDTARGFRKMRQEADKTSKGFLGIRQHTEKLRRGLFSLKGAVAGLVAGFAAYKAIGIGKTFLEAASEAENLQVQLAGLLRSQSEGARLFDEMAKYAATVPHEFKDVMNSAAALAGVMRGGVDEIKKWMPIIGDLAAAYNLPLSIVTGQIIKMYSAGAAAADTFRDRGILAMLGFEAGATYSAEETQRKIIEAWEATDSKFRGLTTEMAKTWTGKMSMLADAWFQFRVKVMETDVFLALKTSLQKFLDAIGVWKKEGRLDEWAEDIATTAIGAFEKIATGAGYVADAFRGWRMILLGVKEAFLTIRHAVSEIVIFTSEKLGWETIEPLEVWKQRAEDIFNKLQATNQELQRLALGESAVTRVKDAFAKLMLEVEETKKRQAEQATETEKTAGAAKKTGEALEYMVEGVKKVVGQSETAAGNFVVMKGVSEEASKSFKERSEELEKQNKLLREQIRLLQTAVATAATPGITSHRYGGLVLHRQLGGPIPGYGGGDRIPGLLEPGEFVLRKEAVRALGTDVLNTLNRGGERGYFTVDFNFPQASLPGVKISADEMGEAFVEFIRHGEKTRGHF